MEGGGWPVLRVPRVYLVDSVRPDEDGSDGFCSEAGQSERGEGRVGCGSVAGAVGRAGWRDIGYWLYWGLAGRCKPLTTLPLAPTTELSARGSLGQMGYGVGDGWEGNGSETDD